MCIFCNILCLFIGSCIHLFATFDDTVLQTWLASITSSSSIASFAFTSLQKLSVDFTKMFILVEKMGEKSLKIQVVVCVKVNKYYCLLCCINLILNYWTRYTDLVLKLPGI